MTRTSKTCVVVCILTAASFGQSFNLDIGGINPGGAGAGTPAPTYGAAAQQLGYWNYITSIDLGPYAIKNLMNNPTSVSCVRTDGLGGAFGYNNGMTTGYFQALMDDGHNTGIAGVVTYRFSGLTPGAYTVYTYGWSPFDPTALLNVWVTGSTTPSPQVAGGALQGVNTFTLGITHVIHLVTITAGMDLEITCSGVGIAGVINGFQVCDGYAMTLTQTVASFPVRVDNFRGLPGYAYANLATLYAGTFPNGPLFGLDMTFAEALAEVAQGVPYFGVLGPNGTATFSVSGLPPGLTAYCVSVMADPTNLAIVAVTAPFYYAIL